MTTLVVCSGGLDSVTLAHLCAQDGPIALVSFQYGQRHSVELLSAIQCARRFNALHTILQLPLHTWGGSALTDNTWPVPEGHYEAETMRQTVVPNRNMVMLSVAASLAIAKGYTRLATGVHAGDHAIYPDCRPEFIDAMQVALRIGNEGFIPPDFTLFAPFLTLTKADIVTIGATLNVPFAETWSCYNGRELHCGRCGTCVERREAFALAGVPDPTPYEA